MRGTQQRAQRQPPFGMVSRDGPLGHSAIHDSPQALLWSASGAPDIVDLQCTKVGSAFDAVHEALHEA